jgi:hypothetical protein
MAAHHHLSGQLAMFIPAKELISYNPNPGDETMQGHTGGREDFWNEKAEESEEYGYLRSVRSEGVRSPVNVYHGPAPQVLPTTDHTKPHIANGHHRVSSAYEADPESLVPVRHYDDSLQPHQRVGRPAFIHATWDGQD